MAHSNNNPEVLPLKEYLKKEIVEILSPDNLWYAGEKLHRPPTPDEAAMHYIKNGGADNFAATHVRVENEEEKKKGKDEKEE